MIGYKLTIQQKNLLVGQQFATNQYFNPIPNIDGVYFIFDGEVEGCVNEEFIWVKELPTADYVPSIADLI
jgi:hypothetical protein